MDLPERMVDAHVHMSDWNEVAQDFVERTSGIAQFWVSRSKRGSDDVVLQAARDMPGRIIPLVILHWSEWAADPGEVDRAFEKGAVGIKAIRPPLPYDHPSYMPIYEKASALCMPILFHTGIIAHATYDPEQVGKWSFGPTNMEPAMLAGIAAAFPELPILGGHLGYPYTEQTHHNLWYYPNITHDICGYVPFEWLIRHLGDRTCHYLGGPEFYYEKILHASDCTLGDEGAQRWGAESHRFWVTFLNHVGRMYPWGKHIDKVLYGNAERIMTHVLEKQGRRAG